MRLFKHTHVKAGKKYDSYSITVPKKLVEDNDLDKYTELEWVQGAKGSLILKPKEKCVTLKKKHKENHTMYG